MTAIRAGVLAVGLALLVLAGCGGGQKSAQNKPASGPTEPLPDYSQVRDAYNARVSRLDVLFARATVRVTWIDEEGKRRTEQGDSGRLQVVRPDRLALSVGKLGETFFWVGSDPNLYWWFDLTDKRLGFVGRHERFRRDQGGPVGLGIHPLEIIAALGVFPMPPEGATQWGKDGSLGVTVAGRDGGLRRLWLDPRTYEPRTIELYAPAETGERPLVLVSSLEEYEFVQVKREMGSAPRMASRVTISHPASQTDLRLTLYGVEEREPEPSAFSLQALIEALRVSEVYDLDTQRSASEPEAGQGWAGADVP